MDADDDFDQEQIDDFDEWAALGVEKIVAGRSDLFTDLSGSSSAPACL